MLGESETRFNRNAHRVFVRLDGLDLAEWKNHFWVQDDWKVNDRLTVNAGLRWEPWTPPTDSLNNLVGFVKGQQSTVAPDAPLGMVYPGDAGISESLFSSNYGLFAPRIGFAYRITDRFKAIFCHAGVYDLTSMYGATEELWFTEWEFKGTPWTNQKMYDRWSPSRMAGKFKTPTYVSHGQLDFRVPVEQGMQLFTALLSFLAIAGAVLLVLARLLASRWPLARDLGTLTVHVCSETSSLTADPKLISSFTLAPPSHQMLLCWKYEER